MGNSNGKPVVLTNEVNLNHFRLLRVVGKGAFGKVRIVERKDTGLTFALKYIRKDEVVRSESVRNIIRERRMLQHLNHPFLCNLRYSFQDMEYLYIVVDLMNGGDLRFHISRKTFTEEAVRFWIAELACALRYIHQQGIVHRDVKPDNILLDSEGHVHLADFNVASDYTPRRPLTSKSGTLAYLAPEVYLGKGYMTEVDWWSLGVTFYECIYNKRPFEGGNHESLAQSIIRAEPPFPVTNPPVSMPCNHAISSLLEKKKSLRIGATSFESFTDNPFFRDIDFAALERKEIEPVFCPPSEKTNFDATYDLEELLLEEAPLEARARKQKPRAELREDATAQEIRADELHRMIETMFEPFNYTLLPVERDVAPGLQQEGVSPESPISANTPSPRGTVAGSNHSSAEAGPSKRPHHGKSKSINPNSTASGKSSRTASPARSGEGSPPFPANMLLPPGKSPARPADVAAPSPVSGNPALHIRDPPRDGGAHTNLHAQNHPDHPGPKPPTSNPIHPHRLRAGTRSTSFGGSANPAREHRSVGGESGDESLGGGGFPATSAPPPSNPSAGKSTAGGVLGFLNRKKGREKSPRAKQRERGVLGKEGARAVVAGAGSSASKDERSR
ncbi:kinase-like protein [Polychaeton citri CBS 116435]|uniref:non-specific serine/threonine protein kinase n=1 Tax=Polychaeton citri CBS 116435 TaxID=1314669 RepID=A0A9P4UVG4_9PEZI|nr:kinase-like protein [Polychaeton citri CBS 116435]